jgi:predicted CXXCH cytochrome family protein
MRILWLALGVAGIVACADLDLTGQNIDSIVTTETRAPISIQDEIQDPAERSAFVALFGTKDPTKMRALARSFLGRYPKSAFLAPVAEKAARSSFDLGDLRLGLEYAHLSFVLFPENPLLLVAVADVQARLQQNESAISSAREALEYFDRFGRPATISAREWPILKQRNQATAWFVIGRALVNEALSNPAGARHRLLGEAASVLSTAHDLNPEDMEIVYLQGLAYQYDGDLFHAALKFFSVYDEGKEFSRESYERLQAIYLLAEPTPQTGLDEFVRNLQRDTQPAAKPSANLDSAHQIQLGGYASSEACGHCHTGIYHQWAESGMARMLRPYLPENVIGDFESNNEFYIGDFSAYQNGKLQIRQSAGRTLFARMIIQNGHHFFEIKQSDGLWHLYPVDYTIGSKWQQAYATKLPNGQIHVFPIQYNVLERKWLNYWKIIDAPGSERSDPHNWEKLDASTNYMINCAVCHTSQLRNSHGGGFDQDNLVFRESGVDCEMCHGPSADHVQAMTEGRYSEKSPLQPPVDFRKIDNQDFVAICGQCHMQSNLHADNAKGGLNYSTTGSFFLKNPERPLNEFTRGTFFRDGRLRQTTFMVEALERSQCFRKGRVSCGNCHDPHSQDEASNLTSLKFKDQPDLMCTGCHTQFQDQQKAADHTHHPYQSEGSRCVSCHMPPIMDAMLFRARSHQIDDIPNAEMTLRFGREESPNACLLCHSERSPEWVQSQLRSWKSGAQAALK